MDWGGWGGGWEALEKGGLKKVTIKMTFGSFIQKIMHVFHSSRYKELDIRLNGLVV